VKEAATHIVDEGTDGMFFWESVSGWQKQTYRLDFRRSQGG